MYVIIEKKKVRVYLIVCFILCVLTTLILGFNTINILEANTTPITNKIVILDAGHGKPDYGTQSKSGTTEQEINLEIVLKLQNMLEQSGAKIILTRSDENGIYEVDKKSIRAKKVSDMNKRVEIGNGSNADMFVSIHMNYYKDGKYSGWQTFYKINNEKSKKMANLIQESLNENIKITKRNPMAIKGNYIIDNVKIPSVIVECGFLSNKEEEQKLKTDEYQNAIAWGIYIGIQKYFMGE